jgi:hypothetical protein
MVGSAAGGELYFVSVKNNLAADRDHQHASLPVFLGAAAKIESRGRLVP